MDSEDFAKAGPRQPETSLNNQPMFDSEGNEFSMELDVNTENS